MTRLALTVLALSPLAACVQTDDGMALDEDWVAEQKKATTCDESGCDSEASEAIEAELSGFYEAIEVHNEDGCPLSVGLWVTGDKSPYDAWLAISVDPDPTSGEASYDSRYADDDDEIFSCEEEEEVMMPSQVVVTGNGGVNITEHLDELDAVFQFRGDLTSGGIEGKTSFKYFEEIATGAEYEGLQVDHVGEDGATSAHFDWSGASNG